MSAPFHPPDRETLAELQRLADRQLTREEVEAAMQIPITEDERRETEALIDWFTRRYPTPWERLAYARRAYARWKRAAVSAGSAQRVR